MLSFLAAHLTEFEIPGSVLLVLGGSSEPNKKLPTSRRAGALVMGLGDMVLTSFSGATGQSVVRAIRSGGLDSEMLWQI